MLILAFSPFPTMFSKGFTFRVIKSLRLCSKELMCQHAIYLLTKRQNFSPIQIESICRQQTTIEKKTLWEKAKQVTSIFSFSHNVFKRPLSQGHEKVEFFGKGSIRSKLSCNYGFIRIILSDNLLNSEIERSFEF